MIRDHYNFSSYAFSQAKMEDEQAKQLIVKAKLGDRIAMDKVVNAHLYIVALRAKDMRGYSMDEEDLQQYGAEVLVKLVYKYDTSSDIKFSTYASAYIDSELKEYIFKNKSLITVKDSDNHEVKRAFFKLRSAMLRNEGNFKKACEEIKVSEKHGNYAMCALHGHLDIYDDEGDVMFDAEVFDETDDEIYDAQVKTALVESIKKLPERERIIIQEHRLSEHPSTLHDLASRFGVSGERIRQIESRGIKMLRDSMNSMVQ